MSLRLKTILSITTIFVTFLALIFFITLTILNQSNENQLNQRETISSSLWILGVQGAIQSSDTETMDKLLKDIKKHPEIQYLKITDSKGAVLSEFANPLFLNNHTSIDLKQDSDVKGPFQKLHKTVYKEGLKYAEIDIIISNLNANPFPEKTFHWLVILVLLSIVLIILISFFLDTQITKKITTLRNAVKNIYSNGPGYTIKLGKPDNTDDIIKTLNQISMDFKVCQDSFNESLEEYIKFDKVSQTHFNKASAIISASKDAFVITDENGIISEFNNIAEEFFGWRADEIIGRNFNTALFPIHAKSTNNATIENDNLLENPSFLHKMTKRVAIHKNGNIFPVEISISKSQFGTDVYYSVVIFDISERVFHEEQLKLAAVALESGDALLITNENFEILTLNSAYSKLTGFVIEEIKGDIPEIVSSKHKNSKYYNQLWSRLSLKQTWTSEAIFYKKDKTAFNGRISIAPVVAHKENISHYVIHLVDITHSKETEKALRESQIKAEKASRAKSQFLANMSHEIRSPLHSILTVNDLLLNHEIGSDAKKLVNISIQGGNSLMNIVNDILDFSKIEAGEMKLQEKRFDLIQIIEEVIYLFEHSAKEKNLNLVCITAPNLPPFFYGDAIRIKQILTNLVSNGIKFTNNGGISINLKYSTTQELIIEVKDTGIGMSKQDQVRVFSEFFQVNDSSTKVQNGTGLGLAIASNLIQLMNGNISLQSQLGLGTNFIVNLPLKKGVTDLTIKNLKTRSTDITSAIVISSDDFLKQIIDEQLLSLDIKLLDINDINKRPHSSAPPSSLMVFVVLQLSESIEEVLSLLQKQLSCDFKTCVITQSTCKNQITKLYKNVTQIQLPILPLDILESIYGEVRPEIEKSTNQKTIINTEQHIHKKILVVDDSKTNQIIAENLLTKQNYQFEFANNGVEAVEKTIQQHFDLILMDVRMPVMNGLEATKRIRAMSSYDKYVPIIAMTANAFIQDQEACLEVGMDDFLTKPLDITKFYEKINKWLEQTQLMELTTTIDLQEHIPHISESESEPESKLILNSETLTNLIDDVGHDVFPIILEVFLQETNSRLNKMHKDWQNDHLNSLFTEAHALKSSAGSFGLLALQKLAREIEFNSEELNRNEMDSAMKELPLKVSQSLDALKTLTKKISDENNPIF